MQKGQMFMAEFEMRQQLADFFREHPGQGRLRVQVSTGRGTFPVEGTRVEVSREMAGGRQVFYRAVSDRSGLVMGITLPVQAAGEEAVGTVYQVWVEHPDYLPLSGRDVLVWPGVETVLPVDLQPRVQ